MKKALPLFSRSFQSIGAKDITDKGNFATVWKFQRKQTVSKTVRGESRQSWPDSDSEEYRERKFPGEVRFELRLEE